MKKIMFAASISLTLIFLAGCGDEVKTSEYYKKNMEEAKARAAECKKMENLNEAQQRDCENANEALLSKRTIRKF